MKVPLEALKVGVSGVALVSVVVDPVTPVPATTVHVPADTEIVVVGLDPEFPERVNVTEVLVEEAK